MWIRPSGVGNLKMLNYIKEEGKLDDSLSSHMGGNWELVLPFSQFVLQPSLCGWIFLQAPESQEKEALTLQAGVSRGYLLWMPFKHLHTANHGHPKPRIDERKQQTECPESKAPFAPALFHQGSDLYPGNTETTTINQWPTDLLSRQTNAPKIPSSIINWLKRERERKKKTPNEINFLTSSS